MDIWVNPTQENKIRKLGFNIPKRPVPGQVRPGRGKIFYGEEEVGFIDDFIGIRIEDDKTEAIKILVDNEYRLNLCLWNIPTKEKV
jgi:hypothetical protein|tara:strand:- start:242 stop:499 length:258 start_codon:yes stop_codon:yes gene_type:complete